MPGTDLAALATAAGNSWNVDPTLLQAMAQTESGGNPQAVSPAGAGGVMQIMPATAQGLGVTNAMDPAQSVYGGAKYLSQLMDRYGRPDLAVAAYNAGPAVVDSYLTDGTTLPAETQAYLPKVLAAYQGIKASQPAGAGQGASDGAGASAGAGASTTPAGAADPFSQILAAARSGPPGGSASAGGDIPASGAAVAAPTAAGSDPFSTILKAAQAGGGAAPGGAAGQGGGQAAQPAAAVPQATTVGLPIHAAPDGSGAMTTLADADYYRLTGSQPQSAPAAAPSQRVLMWTADGTPFYSTPGSSDAAIDVSGARPTAAPAVQAPMPIPAATVAALPVQAASQAPVSPPAGPSPAPAQQPVRPPPAPLQVTGGTALLGAAGAASTPQTNALQSPPALNQPLPAPVLASQAPVQSIGAGLLHGMEAIPQTVINAGAALDARYPWLGQLDQSAGIDLPADAQHIAQQNALYRARYGGNMLAGAGSLAGQIAETVPVMALGGGVLGAAGDAVASGLDAAGLPVLSSAVSSAAPVLAGTAGTGAKGLAGAGTRAVSRALSGATQGVGYGALDPDSNPNLSTGQQVARNALLGAALNVGLPAIGNVLGRGASALIDPLTESGRNRLANAFIARNAQGSSTAINALSPIPGVQRTLAESMSNPGVSGMQRTIMDIAPHAFTAASEHNAQARTAAVDAIRGDGDDLQNLIDQRKAEANQNYSAAFSNKRHANPQPVLDEIDRIMDSPSRQNDAVVQAVGNLRAKIAPSPGVLTTDPEHLDGIRKAAENMMLPNAQAGASSSHFAAREIGRVIDKLDDAIETGASGYKAARDKFASDSAEIDAMRRLQQLDLLSPTTGAPTLAKVDRALGRLAIEKMAPGPRAAKQVTQQAIDGLTALRDDLRQSGNLLLGKALGSDSAQKIATQLAMSQLGSPVAKALIGAISMPGGKFFGGGIRDLYAAQNPRVLDLVANKLADPFAGSTAFLPQSPRNALLRGVVDNSAGPGVITMQPERQRNLRQSPKNLLQHAAN